MSFLSAIGASFYTLGSRRLVQRYHPTIALAWGFPIALIVFAPVMLIGNVADGVPLTAWLLLAYLGIGTQSIAYLLFQWGLQTESATVATIVTLLEPVLAAILAWILFDERLGALGMAGAGLLIAGLLLLSFSPSTAEHSTRGPHDDPIGG
jgi:DME family drug/metabolite transporter